MADYPTTNGDSLSACLFLLNSINFIPFPFGICYPFDYLCGMIPQELISDVLPNFLQVPTLEIPERERGSFNHLFQGGHHPSQKHPFQIILERSIIKLTLPFKVSGSSGISR